MAQRMKIVGGPTKKEKTGKPHDGVALSEPGSEKKVWYGVDDKAAKFLSNFKMGDEVEVNIENGLVKFIKKVYDSTGNTEPNTPRDKPAQKSTYVDNAKGQEFGCACNVAVRILAATINDTDDYIIKYKDIVRKVYAANKELKEELVK